MGPFCQAIHSRENKRRAEGRKGEQSRENKRGAEGTRRGKKLVHTEQFESTGGKY